MARRPARDRGGATPPAPVRPRLRGGRRRQRRRGRRGPRGEGRLFPALLRDGLCTRATQGRPAREGARGAQGGIVATPGGRGRLDRRLSPPPTRLLAATVPQ